MYMSVICMSGKMNLDGGFHRWGYPKKGGFIVESPVKMHDDWGYPHLWNPPVYCGLFSHSKDGF